MILSAGAIGSPQLLMLSGIGPADHLRDVGVGVVVDNPAVGGNLMDHPYVVCVWEATVAESLYGADKPKPLLEWLLRRSGPLTSTVAEAFAFVRSRPGLPAPDLQYHFAPAYFVDNGAEEFDGHAFTMGPTLVTPKSRGEIRLAAADPLAKPKILTNSLSEPEDVAALVTGVELARELAMAEPLASARGREIYPGAEIRDDADVEDFIRRNRRAALPPVRDLPDGRRRRGPGSGAARPRHRGPARRRTRRVFPLIPGGNTNAPTIMVAERAADLIKNGSAAAAGAAAACAAAGTHRPP